MTSHALPLLILIPVIALLIWRRVRRQFGRQPIQRKRMFVRIALLAGIGALMALGSLHNMPLLEGLLTGALIGAVLGFIGLRLTRFERSADGSDGYVPNPWIGGLLTALLVGRLAWRFFVVMPQLEQAEAGAHAFPGIGNSPLTLAMLGLLVGYYVVYFSGLLIHHRRFEQRQAALASGS